jgi:hypothetical protein
MFYTFVLVMNQLFEIVRQAFQRGAGFSIVIQLLVLALSQDLVLTIPMSLLLGVLVGLGRLSRIPRSSRCARPASSLLAHGAARGLSGVLGFLVGRLRLQRRRPWANRQNLERAREHAAHDRSEPRDTPGLFYDEIPDTLIYAEEVVRGDRVWPLRRIIVATSRADASIVTDEDNAPHAADGAEPVEPEMAPPPDRTVVLRRARTHRGCPRTPAG